MHIDAGEHTRGTKQVKAKNLPYNYMIIIRAFVYGLGSGVRNRTGEWLYVFIERRRS